VQVHEILTGIFHVNFSIFVELAKWLFLRLKEGDIQSPPLLRRMLIQSFKQFSMESIQPQISIDDTAIVHFCNLAWLAFTLKEVSLRDSKVHRFLSSCADQTV
jgi:hypothetical protein